MSVCLCAAASAVGTAQLQLTRDFCVFHDNIEKKKKHTHKKSACLFALTATSLMALPSQAQETVTEGIKRMVLNGTVSLDFRYRYEFVDQDGIDEHANASTQSSPGLP